MRRRIPALTSALLLLACSGTTTTTAPTGPLGDGLPCDVAAVLASQCWTCHGSQPSHDAPMSLATRADLQRASPLGGTYLQRSLARMQAATLPMPPTGAPSADLVAVLAAYQQAGAPTGTCGDGGVPDAGPIDASVKTGTDLPCAVRDLLTHDCVSCHSDPPRAAGAMPLLTLDELRAPSASTPGMSVAQLAVVRMRAATNPMPPGGGEPAERVDAFAAWVASGMPGGRCDAPATDPFAAAPTCTSGTTWTRGNRGNVLMNPGQACVSCHAAMRGPSYPLGGTLYPTGHEPNNCNGSGTAADGTVPTIEVTDATGRVIRMQPNAAGNFYSRTNFTPPYTARVVVGDTFRAMNTPQTSGDCNDCHTPDGANTGDTGDPAPGRIVLP